MKYDFDLICIGLGPAGMAISAMGAEMGLKVCAIEKNERSFFRYKEMLRFPAGEFKCYVK